MARRCRFCRLCGRIRSRAVLRNPKISGSELASRCLYEWKASSTGETQSDGKRHRQQRYPSTGGDKRIYHPKRRDRRSVAWVCYAANLWSDEVSRVAGIRQSLYCIRTINRALVQVDQDTRHGLESVRAEHVGDVCNMLAKEWQHVKSATDAESLICEVADAMREHRPLMSYESA